MVQNIKLYLDNLTDQLQKDNKLEKLIYTLYKKYNLIPRIGAEIEFYLSPEVSVDKLATVLALPIHKERGENQFEIILPPNIDMHLLITQLDTIKQNIPILAKELGGSADFCAKPFANDYGNSIHFHIDFLNNKLHRVDFYDLDQMASSLCHYLLQYILVFMPYTSDYQRIDKNFLCPTHVCYGNNNRTAAIRIPEKLPKRLEHRIASPNCYTYLSIYAMLKSIFIGLEQPELINDGFKVYGNAFDPQYKLVPLPKDIKEALEYFDANFFS